MMAQRRIYLVLGVLLAYGIFLFLIYLWVRTPLPDGSRPEDDQEIYSALINGYDIFEERTSLEEIELSQEIVQYIRDEVPSLEESTLDDFRKINRQSYLIKDYLPANDNYVFLGAVEVELFYSDWEAFSKKHRDARVIVSFSRIGFSSSFNQALVLINSSAKLFDAPFEYGGSGLLYLFGRLNGKWVEQYQLVLSITG